MAAFISKVATSILNPAIILVFVIALVVFLWGVLQFVRKADDEEARSTGRRHIVYGIIGMAIMISAFGILKFVTNTFGFDSAPIDNLQGGGQ